MNNYTCCNAAPENGLGCSHNKVDNSLIPVRHIFVSIMNQISNNSLYLFKSTI